VILLIRTPTLLLNEMCCVPELELLWGERLPIDPSRFSRTLLISDRSGWMGRSSGEQVACSHVELVCSVRDGNSDS
jgi:hypothetical protein